MLAIGRGKMNYYNYLNLHKFDKIKTKLYNQCQKGRFIC